MIQVSRCGYDCRIPKLMKCSMLYDCFFFEFGLGYDACAYLIGEFNTVTCEELII